MSKRRMHLMAVCTAGPHMGSWLHPESENRYFDAEWWGDLARTLERARFDAIFFADVQTFYAEEMMRKGGDLYLLDPVPLAASIAARTERIGIGITISTSLVEPYAIARSMQTLDVLSRGRVAWNVVTSSNQREARVYGREALLPKAERYDRADEAVEACMRLWESFPAEALVADQSRNLYIDPERLLPVDYRGEHVSTNGVLAIPPGPQGRPVIMQAGASPRGRDFAAKWSEIIFTYGRSRDGMRAFRADMERRFVAAGRSPEECRILPAVQAIVGETEEIARARHAYLFSLIDVDVSVARAAEYIGFDLTALDPNSRIDDIDLSEVARGGASDIFFDTMRDEGYTIGETAQRFSFNYLGPEFVGTPEQVADQMEEVFDTWGIDGFILAPSVMPGSFEDFARMVVPILQQRGLVRSEYTGTTLRDHLAQRDG